VPLFIYHKPFTPRCVSAVIAAAGLHHRALQESRFFSPTLITIIISPARLLSPAHHNESTFAAREKKTLPSQNPEVF
jgi:hypothetical protein